MKGTPMDTRLEVRPAAARYTTRLDWLDSRHAFSFGRHYDPANTGFGLLLVSNEDVVRTGAGFDTHPHRDMEIVTWVLSGSLVHQDSEGHSGVIHPGLAQRMSAGTGILHSEKNDSWRLTGGEAHHEDVHFVQMWVLPDETSLDPGYQQLDISAELVKGGWVTVASGRPRDADSTAIRIHQRQAALHAARLEAGDTVELPTAPFVHLQVTNGSVALEGAGSLVRGDTVRVVGASGERLTALAHAEVLAWQMDGTASGR
jgi:redox-sensitive bicupin YhaK (pirin superfamily)